MNKAKRYNTKVDENGIVYMVEKSDGNFVYSEDYEELESAWSRVCKIIFEQDKKLFNIENYNAKP